MDPGTSGTPGSSSNIHIVHQNISQTFYQPAGAEGRSATLSPDAARRLPVPALGNKSTFFNPHDSLSSLTPDHGGLPARKHRLMKSANLRTAGLLNLADHSIKAQI